MNRARNPTLHSGDYVEDTANAPAGNNGDDDADFLYIQSSLGF